MTNYVQVRFQTSSSSTVSINHDFRLSKVNYLRDDIFHNKWENQYFDFDPINVKQSAKRSYYEYNKLYSDNHLAKYGKRRNLTKGKQSDYLTGVITLSNSVNDMLAYRELSKDQLEQCFVEAVERVKSLLEEYISHELEQFSYVIHYDEKTPHMHFAFANHTNNGKAIYHMLRTSKKQVLSKFQDEVGKAFNKIGFRRGEIKDKTNARHKSVREMHQVEINELKAKKKELEEDNKVLKTLQQQGLRLKEQIKKLKGKKKEIKLHVKSLDVSATEAKKELDQIDIKIKELREAINYDKDLMNNIKELFEAYESSDPDGTVSELLSQINKIDMINNPNYKLKVSEMLSNFNKRISNVKRNIHDDTKVDVIFNYEQKSDSKLIKQDSLKPKNL